MNKEATSCKIVADIGGVITRFVCNGLGEDISWLDEHLTLGFMQGDRIIGGIIYHNIRLGQDVWWTIYTIDKRWCTRRILKFLFGLAFNYFGCQRISLSTDTDNIQCIKLAQKLGFKAEGVLRKYRDNGKDAVIMGILKQEYKLQGDKKCQKV